MSDTAIIDIPIDNISRVDVSQALKQRILKKLTYQEIAELQGVSKQAIHQALKPILSLSSDPQALEAYRENKADLLDMAQLKFLSHSVDPDQIKKLSSRDAIVSYGILFDKARLERGQSTDNIDLHATTQDIHAIQAEIEAKRNQLASLKAQVGNDPEE